MENASEEASNPSIYRSAGVNNYPAESASAAVGTRRKNWGRRGTGGSVAGEFQENLHPSFMPASFYSRWGGAGAGAVPGMLWVESEMNGTSF